MRATLSVGLLVALLPGCAAKPPSEPALSERRVPLACNNGERMEMRFLPAQGVGVLMRNDASLELQQQPVASGFMYSSGPNSVRGKGDEITVENGTVSLKCRAL